jgi:hypothetical protein
VTITLLSRAKAEVTANLPLQQGLGGPRGDELLHGVSVQLLLPVRTVRTKAGDGRWQQRTPVMAAGLADHVWTLEEWVHFPAIQCK